MDVGKIIGAAPLPKIDGVSNKANFIKVDKNDGNDFLESIKKGLDSVKNIQDEADNKIQQAISGNDIEISEVMISTLKAEMSMQLTMQVRNKLVDAYQEITRMPM